MFLVIDVLIEGLDQQFSMSLTESLPDVPRDYQIIDRRIRPFAQYCFSCCLAILRRESAQASGPELARHLGEDWRAALPDLISTRRDDTRSTDCKQVPYAPS